MVSNKKVSPRRWPFVAAGLSVLIFASVIGLDVSIRSSVAKLDAESVVVNKKVINALQAQEVGQDHESKGGLFEKIKNCSIYATAECNPQIVTYLAVPLREDQDDSSIAKKISDATGYTLAERQACNIEKIGVCSFVLSKDDFRLSGNILAEGSAANSTTRSLHLKIMYR